jgi:hypothetical protein
MSNDMPARVLHPGQHASTALNANSYVSIGLLITIIAATWVIASSVNKVTSSINDAKTEFGARMERFESRVAAIEKNRETWTDGDMFRWAVHLQKENPTLKVPEPEMHSSR